MIYNPECNCHRVQCTSAIPSLPSSRVLETFCWVVKAVALAYCLLWNRRYIMDFIKRINVDLQAGRESAGLPELHATLSGMKAASTVRAHSAIEECRKACGGQGFLLSSGIAKLAPDFSEWVTVEGEQVILSLQCARFLIKAVDDIDDPAVAVTPADTVQYLAADPPAALVLGGGAHNGDIGWLVEWLGHRARALARRLAAEVDSAVAAGVGFEVALNSRAVLAYRAADAHVAYVMLDNNCKAIESYFSDQPEIKTVMSRLLELHGLSEIAEHLGDWIEVPTSSGAALPRPAEIDERIRVVLRAVRPDAVALVDGFGLLDSQLKSTIGRKDGQVYDAIYAEARRNPLNADGPMVGWDQLASVLDLGFLEETARRQRVAPAAKL